MAAIAVLTMSRAGIVNTGGAAASAGGDTLPNDGSTLLLVNNASGASITVTLPLTRTVDGQAAASKTVAVAASTTAIIGPFATSDYNDATGSLAVAYSAVTSVTVKGITVPRTY